MLPYIPFGILSQAFMSMVLAAVIMLFVYIFKKDFQLFLFLKISIGVAVFSVIANIVECIRAMMNI